MAGSERRELETAQGPVSALLDGPEDSDVLLVLAPGAGAPIAHEFMQKVASGLGEAGLRVARFNFSYLESGRKSPDKQPVLVETYRSAVRALAKGSDHRKTVLGGKSMGGRIASHLVAEGFEADGLVFLGYPLHPPGRPDRIRDKHLHDVKVPMLFVEGTRDPFCPLETLARVREELPGPTDLVVIDDGDHSFKVRKSSGRSTADALDEAVRAVASWVSTVSN